MTRTPALLALSTALLVGCGSDPPTITLDAAPSDVSVADANDATLEDRALQDVLVPQDMTAPVDIAMTDVPVAVDLAPDTAADVLLADASAGPYPPGPYGNRVGSVLANLSWEGYVNPTGGAVSTTRTYGPTSLQALRGSGRGYALVHVADFY